MDDVTMNRMLDLLRDPAFMRMRAVAHERPLPRTEFDELPLPAGITRDQAWEVLNILRRQTAVMLPFLDGRGRTGWYYPTRSMLTELTDIDWRCHEGSWLDEAIKSRNTTYYLVEAHLEEAITAIREDGLKLGYEKAREVLLEERAPESPEEVLLLNGHRAIWDLGEYADAPCTSQLIVELHRRVSRGVGDQAAATVAHHTQLWEHKKMDSQEALELIAKLVNSQDAPDAEGVQPPLHLAMAVRHLFMSTLPLPSWNGMVSSLVMKLLFMKSRLPVLAFVPVLEACREWESGVVRPPEVTVAFSQSEVLINGEVDYTLYMAVVTELVRRKLDNVEEDLHRAMQRDEEFSHTLHRSIEINHRQRMVLKMALNNPAATFRIATHQRTHKVAYATARADLLKLVELGFLKCGQGKRAFEFTVVPGLRQLLVAEVLA